MYTWPTCGKNWMNPLGRDSCKLCVGSDSSCGKKYNDVAPSQTCADALDAMVCVCPWSITCRIRCECVIRSGLAHACPVGAPSGPRSRDGGRAIVFQR